MPEKMLTEAAWKSFAKGKDYKDAALLKAMKALDQAAKDDPAAALQALDDIEKQLDALRKTHKGDKALTGQLDEIETAMGKERKLQQKQQDARASESAGDDEEDSPALLTSKLLPLLREVRKGTVTLSAMIATTGKDTAVMLSRRSIPPARSKLLKDYLGAGGGVKIIAGECLLEDNAVTFVVQSQAAGLAKKLKQALLAQVEQRVKVRVRGLEPGDVDEEAEEDGPNPGPTPPGPTDSGPPVDEAQQRFQARLDKLSPLVAAALRAQKGDTGKMRAVLAFAQEKGQSGAWAAALQALETLEKLLAAAAQPEAQPAPTGPEATGQSETTPGKVEAGTAFNARLAALMPAVKEALVANGPAANDIKQKVGAAGLQARKGLFDEAHALLDEAEALMSGPPTAPSPGVDPNAALWQQRSQSSAQVLAQKVPPGSPDAAKLQAILDHATKLATGGDLTKALAALDQLDKVLAARVAPTPQPGTPPKRALVAYRSSLLAYRQAAQLVKGRIQTLKQTIPQALPAEQELADALAVVLDEHNELLLDAVDQAMNAVQGEQAGVSQALASTIDAYLALLSSDPLIRAADNNPFGVAMNIRDTLFDALSEVRRTMPAPV